MASDAIQYGASHLRTCLSKQKPNGESIPIERRALIHTAGNFASLFAGHTSKTSHVSLLLTGIVKTSDTNLTDVCISEITGARNIPTQHHDAVFTGFGGSAKLCAGEGGGDLLTHRRRQCMAASNAEACCKFPEKPRPLPHIIQFLCLVMERTDKLEEIYHIAQLIP